MVGDKIFRKLAAQSLTCGVGSPLKHCEKQSTWKVRVWRKTKDNNYLRRPTRTTAPTACSVALSGGVHGPARSILNRTRSIWSTRSISNRLCLSIPTVPKPEKYCTIKFHQIQSFGKKKSVKSVFGKILSLEAPGGGVADRAPEKFECGKLGPCISYFVYICIYV